MGMEAILFNCMQPFEQTVNTLSTEAPPPHSPPYPQPREIWWKLLKWFQWRHLKILVLYMYIAQGQG